MSAERSHESRIGPVVALVLVLAAGILAIVGRLRAEDAPGPDYQAIVSLRTWVRAFVRARCAPELALDPEDLTAEVLLRAAVSWASFAPADDDRTDALRRWISGIARNTVAERLRNAGIERHALLEYQRTLADPRLDEVGPVAAQIEARSLLAILRTSTAAENWRAVLAQDEGLTAAEAATIEGVPTSTIHYRLLAARQDFEAALTRIAALEAWRTPR